MNKHNYNIYLLIGLIINLFILSSCEKQEYTDGFIEIGEVYFEANNLAINQTEEGRLLHAKANGHDINWTGSGGGKIEAPEGDVIFEFYNLNTGEVMLEKKVKVIVGNPEHYTFFQPVLEAPLTFLDPDAQANEEAAPDGFWKVKLVNYAGDLLPFDKVDVTVIGAKFDWNTWTMSYEDIKVLPQIGVELNDEPYHLIPKPGNGIETIYFAFKDSNGGTEITNDSGNRFITVVPFNPMESFPNAQKNVFSLYLKSNLRENSSPDFIKMENRYYDILPVVFLGN